MDLFVTYLNAKLTLYIAQFLDSRVEEVDALIMSGRDQDIYAFPPTNLIIVMLRKVRKEPCPMLLIALAWPKHILFLDLMGLVQDAFVQLPHIRTLFR